MPGSLSASGAKQLRDRAMVLPHGEAERGCAEIRLGIDVGAPVEQGYDDPLVVICRGKHQRSLADIGLGIDVGAPIEQRLHQLNAPHGGREDQGRLTISGVATGSRAVGKQSPHDRVVA